MKKIDYLSYIILASIFVTSYFAHNKLSDIKYALETTQYVPKIEIVDNKQFNRLAKQLSEQWLAEEYAIYILQPNAPAKTHKEKVVSSLNLQLQLPSRTPLHSKELNDDLYLNKHKYIEQSKLDLLLPGIEQLNKNYYTILILPIYNYDVIIGEIYLFYCCKSDLDRSALTKMQEAQVFTKLLY